MEVQAVPVWQVVTLVTLLSWLRFARFASLTMRLRSLLQPPAEAQVQKGIATVLWIQSRKNRVLDAVFAAASSVVSVEFYTAFLPFLFWSGHCWLARQMTILMAVCIYVGNCLKDTVCAPRPSSPPVRRLTAIKCEEESAMEFGLPSSHTINTICLSIYLLTYFTQFWAQPSSALWWLVLAAVALLIFLVAYGRLYLGMHTPVDVLTGIPIGLCLLLLWCFADHHLDHFVLKGENVVPFSISISVLLLFAYPKGEHKTPSYEFHTAFNGVVLGVICGSHRFYSYSQAPELSFLADAFRMAARLAVGFPLILATKALCKELARLSFPPLCKLLNLPIRSSAYVSGLQEKVAAKKRGEHNRNFWLRLLPAADEEFLDVDTGIRLFQYAALGWSVVEMVPCIFEQLGL